ncbi:MAG: hypothetical protein JW841_11565 [Deltaproteobacteria bacterium]|nr:hypothetical protein [Deltaproteobacteria bacterium]
MTKRKKIVLFISAVCTISISSLFSFKLLHASGSAPTASQVPANNTNSINIKIAKFGRYAIIANSKQGVGLQLVDRMAGPGKIYGAAGQKNGRLDEFLENGDYKLITHGHPKAHGKANIKIHEFKELHAKNHRN